MYLFVVQIDMAFKLFAILQKYDFSSKSQHDRYYDEWKQGCLRYCKSTIFQANHNNYNSNEELVEVVCDTAKVRFFKQITTPVDALTGNIELFAILQKYDFSSKSQRSTSRTPRHQSCLRYCKSTIFQANHNAKTSIENVRQVVCDTAKVRFFKQITTKKVVGRNGKELFAILQKYDFSSKSQLLSF